MRTADTAVQPVAVGPATLRGEMRALGRLAAPIAAAQILQMTLGVVDTAVVGRLGKTELAAVGLGNSVLFFFKIGGLGVMLGVDPLVSQALGAGRAAEAREVMWQGVWLALLLSLPLAALSLGTGAALGVFGVPEHTASLARAYIAARLPEMAPYLLYFVARSYLSAIDRPMSVLSGAIVANLLNLALDWGLVFGDAGLERVGLPAIGLPQLGVVGAGIASFFASSVQLVIAARAVLQTRVEGANHRPDVRRMRRALALGLPQAVQRFAEVGAFSLVGLLMGRFGDDQLAGHQLTFTIVSTTFMVPLGVSVAASVRVGRAVGARDALRARRAGEAALVIGGGFMLLCAVGLLLAPTLLVAAFTGRDDLAEASRGLLVVGALFQVSDGLQVVATGALRGLGDTRGPAIANLFAHYLVGLPLGVALGLGVGLEGAGLWWGLFAGLTVVAGLLTHRFLRLSRGTIEPLAQG